MVLKTRRCEKSDFFKKSDFWSTANCEKSDFFKKSDFWSTVKNPIFSKNRIFGALEKSDFFKKSDFWST
jgi:acid phosphatase class B